MKWLLLISVIGAVIMILRLFRKPIRKWVYTLRAKLRIRSLREAIGEADDNKQKTGRKTMVVFNRDSGKYEPLEKKILKAAARAGKNKNNGRQTEGRKKMRNIKKKRYINSDRAKQIEKNSLYVTK